MKTKLIKGFGTLILASMILSGCGDSNGGKKGGCQHEYGDWFADLLPTETETGVASRMCDLCEEIQEVDLPVLTDAGYTFGADSATCVGSGIKKVSYEFEDGSSIDFGVQTSAKGHDYVSHDAVEPTEAAPIGYEMYYSCSRCTALFNSEKVAIDSMDDIKVSYYEYDENQHWRGNGTRINHTFGEYTVDKEPTMTTAGSKSHVCSGCGYKAVEAIDPIDIGVLNADGTYNASTIVDRSESAPNKLADGLYIMASSGKKISFDSNGNVVTGGKSNVDARFVLFKTSGAAKVTIKGSSGKNGTACTFGFMKNVPTEEGFEFEGDTYSSSTSSTADYDFVVNAAGTYYIGASATWKIKSVTVEIHEIADGWVKDAEGHWHGSTNPACTNKTDYADHTFGAWEEKTPATATTKGVESHKCSVCDYEETREFDLHNFDMTHWSTNAEQHWHACTDSGYENLKKDDNNHTFGEPTVSGNTLNYTCSVCNYVKTVHTTMYLPSLIDGGSAPIFTSANPFTVAEDSTTMIGSGMAYVEDDAENPTFTHEFTTLTAGTQSFSSAAKYTGGMVAPTKNQNNLSIHLPGACKITLYIANLAKEGNFRIYSSADNYAVATVINGATKVALGTYTAYTVDIAAAGDYKIGCSSSDMGSLGFYIYAIEIVY